MWSLARSTSPFAHRLAALRPASALRCNETGNLPRWGGYDSAGYLAVMAKLHLGSCQAGSLYSGAFLTGTCCPRTRKRQPPKSLCIFDWPVRFGLCTPCTPGVHVHQLCTSAAAGYRPKTVGSGMIATHDALVNRGDRASAAKPRFRRVKCGLTKVRELTSRSTRSPDRPHPYSSDGLDPLERMPTLGRRGIRGSTYRVAR